MPAAPPGFDAPVNMFRIISAYWPKVGHATRELVTVVKMVIIIIIIIIVVVVVSRMSISSSSVIVI